LGSGTSIRNGQSPSVWQSARPHPPAERRFEVSLQSYWVKEVKGEGEEPLPISLSYININSSCVFHFPRTRVWGIFPSPSSFTILRIGQIGQVPENLPRFLCVQINLPGPGRNRRWGEGFCRPGQAGSGIVEKTRQEVILHPRADRAPTSRWSGFKDHLDAFLSAPLRPEPSAPTPTPMSHKWITVIRFLDTLRRRPVT
jgi:hypothetical protein